MGEYWGRGGQIGLWFSHIKRRVQVMAILFAPKNHYILSTKLQIIFLRLLKKGGINPWYALSLPSGLKCYYKVTERIDGSVLDLFSENEYFLFDDYRMKEGQVIVDVGAYVGLYSLLASKFVGFKGRVVSVEPEPHSYCMLTNNLRINNMLGNVARFNLALSSEIGTMNFFVPKSASGSTFFLNHLLSQTIGEYSESSVQTLTCDRLFETLKINRVDIMKIDVEGAELEVLKGAEKTLQSGVVDRLVIEVHKSVNTPKSVIELLKCFDYKVRAYVDINESKGILYAAL